MKSSKLWTSQLWSQFKQLHIEAWKSQDFNGVWTRDLAIPVQRSNQLSYEATVSYLNCDHNCEDHSLLEKTFCKWGKNLFVHFINTKIFRKVFSSQRLLVEKMLSTWWPRVSGSINTMVEMAACETNITCIAYVPFKFADNALLVHNWQLNFSQFQISLNLLADEEGLNLLT